MRLGKIHEKYLFILDVTAATCPKKLGHGLQKAQKVSATTNYKEYLIVHDIIIFFFLKNPKIGRNISVQKGGD